MRRLATRTIATLLAGSLLFACSLDYLSSDYGTAPGGTTSDGGADADGGGPEEPSCSEVGDPRPTFCDYFDRSIDPGWKVSQARGGSVTRRPEGDLLIAVREATQRPGAVACLMKELSESANSVRISFFIDAPESIGKTQQPVVTLELPHDGKLTQVSLLLSDDGTRVKEREVLGDGGGAPTGYSLKTKLPSGGVTVDMTLTLGTAPKLDIAYNTIGEFSHALVSSLPRAPHLRVYFGPQEAEVPTGAWNLHIDNVDIFAE